MSTVRCMHLILALCIAACSLCVLPAPAQESVSVVGDPVVASDSGSDNAVADAVLLGLIVTVVGILLWLGWKTDHDRAKARRHDAAESMDEHEAWVATLNEEEPVEDHRVARQVTGIRF